MLSTKEKEAGDQLRERVLMRPWGQSLTLGGKKRRRKKKILKVSREKQHTI
jgi:hypothetical protein